MSGVQSTSKNLENEKSLLFKHKLKEHKNEKVNIHMEITKKLHDASSRQANEAVQIFNQPDHELLNSKSEFNPLP